MYKCQERNVELVIASKYPAKPLESLEERLNQMPFFVSIPIHRPRISCITLWWNGICGFLRINICPDGFRSVGLITKDVTSLDIDLAEQGNGVYRIMVTAGTEQKNQADCPSHPLKHESLCSYRLWIYQQPYFLIFSPPFALWCTLHDVESMETFSKSASMHRVWKILSNTPISRHFRNRL